MSYKVVVPLTEVESRVLDLFGESACGLNMPDILQQLSAGQAGSPEALVRSAVWRLLADQYLDMTPEREIRRHQPPRTVQAQAAAL